MKKFFSIGILIGVMVFFGVQTFGAETIRMGYLELQPHMYASETTGRPAGAVVMFFERIAERMGYDVTWVGPLPDARLVDYLEKGRVFDGDPLMSMTSERKKFLYFPRTPFYLAKPNLVVRSKKPLKTIAFGDDIKGYVVGQFSKAANSKFINENQSLFHFDMVSGGKT